MIEIASFVGPSGCGKSTLTENVSDLLVEQGHESVIIKKDDAIRALSMERHGDELAYFSWHNQLDSDRIVSADLHGYMNGLIYEALSDDKFVMLEGGTRTRKSQGETLEGINPARINTTIFLMQLPFRVTARRLMERRATGERDDDTLTTITAKLIGQYMRPLISQDSPRIGDSDVIGLDATLSPDELAIVTTEHILNDSLT